MMNYKTIGAIGSILEALHRLFYHSKKLAVYRKCLSLKCSFWFQKIVLQKHSEAFASWTSFKTFMISCCLFSMSFKVPDSFLDP